MLLSVGSRNVLYFYCTVHIVHAVTLKKFLKVKVKEAEEKVK